MADFNFALTASGAALLAKAQADQALQFSSLVMGDGTYDGENADATAVQSAQKTLPVSVSAVKSNVAYLSAALAYSDVTEEFQWRELGLYAKDPDTSEAVLYLYGYAGDKGDWITPGVSATAKRINLAITVTGVAEITATISQDEIYALADLSNVSDEDFSEKARSAELIRHKKQASFTVSDTDAVMTKSMTVDMSTLSEASIDVYAVVGSGVTLTVGGQEVMQSSVWGDVLTSTDVIHVTTRLECRDGLWLIGIAAPMDADTTVQPVVTSGYLSESTDNDISVSIVLTSASDALSAGCEGEIWGR